MTDPTTLTDADLDTLTRACIAEQQRRETITAAPAQAEALAAAVSTALGRTDGSLWTDHAVTGAHDVWPPAVICQHPEGEYWRAGRLESHPPGTIGAPWARVYPDGDGWTETPPAESGPVPWAVGISAVGADDPEGRPQTLLAHGGRIWRAKVTHTTHAGWVPSVHTHAVWEDMGPA